jgi:hypothetical protein
VLDLPINEWRYTVDEELYEICEEAQEGVMFVTDFPLEEFTRIAHMQSMTTEQFANWLAQKYQIVVEIAENAGIVEISKGL